VSVHLNADQMLLVCNVLKGAKDSASIVQQLLIYISILQVFKICPIPFGNVFAAETQVRAGQSISLHAFPPSSSCFVKNWFPFSSTSLEPPHNCSANLSYFSGALMTRLLQVESKLERVKDSAYEVLGLVELCKVYEARTEGAKWKGSKTMKNAAECKSQPGCLSRFSAYNCRGDQNRSVEVEDQAPHGAEQGQNVSGEAMGIGKEGHEQGSIEPERTAEEGHKKEARHGSPKCKGSKGKRKNKGGCCLTHSSAHNFRGVQTKQRE
jgi:hypothetical protein